MYATPKPRRLRRKGSYKLVSENELQSVVVVICSGAYRGPIRASGVDNVDGKRAGKMRKAALESREDVKPR